MPVKQFYILLCLGVSLFLFLLGNMLFKILLRMVIWLSIFYFLIVLRNFTCFYIYWSIFSCLLFLFWSIQTSKTCTVLKIMLNACNHCANCLEPALSEAVVHVMRLQVGRIEEVSSPLAQEKKVGCFKNRYHYWNHAKLSMDFFCPVALASESRRR